MAAGDGILISGGNLMILGKKILSDVRDNVLLTPASGDGLLNGAFIGVRSDRRGSHNVFPIGKLQDLRFMCSFRFKLWWMTQRMGSSGKEIPFETQFMIVELNDGSYLGETNDRVLPHSEIYTVFLPILEGDFRAVLQGNENDDIEISLESGDPSVDHFEGTHLAFIGAGSDPYDTITNSVRIVEGHLQTFSHRERKKIPDILNWFGWCTWDAFYTNVTAQGVKQGLESLEKGGIPPKFVIIDDGWQSVGIDASGVLCDASSVNLFSFASRLTNIKENYKFQKNGKEGYREEDPSLGLAHIVNEIKEKHGVKYVYMWHAITGYWGGVKPDECGMEQYESMLRYPITSPAVKFNEACVALNSIANSGLGLVNPEKVFRFYDELHSYLASAGVDGVKVDAQNILETLGAGHGGRVKLARKYHEALEASIARNFHDNGIISCMSHNTDGLYSAKKSAIIRASEDFFPRDPASHTIHIASVAYNTVFLGEFMQPDWDMFHSLHPMAEYHGAARAVGGCAIYVSDQPGNHDFNLLKKLVLPDGSILRAKLPGRPTRDCLFSDPTRDGKSLLKIWNLNDHCGVIGVFNCQGAGWCKVGKTNVIHDQRPGTITGCIRGKDVEYLAQVAEDDWNGDVIVYSHLGGEVAYLPKDASLPITLKPREFEVFTVAPIKILSDERRLFAPVGLVKMLNSGGAVKKLRYVVGENAAAKLAVRGCGVLAAYSSIKPKKATVESKEVGFSYDAGSGLVTLVLSVPQNELYLWNVSIEF